MKATAIEACMAALAKVKEVRDGLDNMVCGGKVSGDVGGHIEGMGNVGGTVGSPTFKSQDPETIAKVNAGADTALAGVMQGVHDEQAAMDKRSEDAGHEVDAKNSADAADKKTNEENQKAADEAYDQEKKTQEIGKQRGDEERAIHRTMREAGYEAEQSAIKLLELTDKKKAHEREIALLQKQITDNVVEAAESDRGRTAELDKQNTALQSQVKELEKTHELNERLKPSGQRIDERREEAHRRRVSNAIDNEAIDKAKKEAREKIDRPDVFKNPDPRTKGKLDKDWKDPDKPTPPGRPEDKDKPQPGERKRVEKAAKSSGLEKTLTEINASLRQIKDKIAVG